MPGVPTNATYRLKAPLLALKRNGTDHPNLQTLPWGSTITTAASPVSESGLLDVFYNGVVYTVYEVDLFERGELIR